MRLLEMTVNATFILSLALTLLAFVRSMSAAAKHVLCAVTFGSILLLPVISLAPFHRPPALLNVTIEPASVPLTGQVWMSWMIVLWAGGVSAILFRFAAGVVYLAWLTRRSSADATALTPAHIAVRYVDVTTPVMWGWVRPVILLPVCVRDWAPEARKAAIDHELAHHDRGDAWTSLLVMAAQAVYWFHPLVWWLSNKLVEQREFAADERVLSSGTESTLYAKLLLSLARDNRSSALSRCAMTSGSLRSRVQRVLRPMVPQRSLWSRVVFCGSIGLVLLSALVVPARARFPEQIYTIGGDVAAPQLVRKIEPNYTKKARREKTQGTVLLGVVISKEGKARSVTVERSLTPDLDHQAVHAVSAWRFKPATRAGKPVSVQAKIEVNFRLL